MTYADKDVGNVKRTRLPECRETPLKVGHGPEPEMTDSALMDFAEQSIEVAPRMARMRVVFGLEEMQPAVGRRLNLQMVRVCSLCAHRQLCEQTLATGTARPDDVEFCPNKQEYEAFAAASR